MADHPGIHLEKSRAVKVNCLSLFLFTDADDVRPEWVFVYWLVILNSVCLSDLPPSVLMVVCLP